MLTVFYTAKQVFSSLAPGDNCAAVLYDTDKHKCEVVTMEENKAPQDDSNELESLETEQPADGSINASTGGDSSDSDAKKDDKKPSKNPLKAGGIRGLVSRVNIYLLGFVLLVVIVGSGGGIIYLNSNKKAATENKLKSQALSTDSLKQLSNSDVTVGDSKQVLTVQSNAIFGGSVLLKGDVEVAGKLVVGSDLALTGINVSGKSTLQDLDVSNNLSVANNLAVKGQVTIQNGLTVNGTTSFAGLSVQTLTVSSLQINNTLNLTHHIIGGGGRPSRSSGSALGSGGTSSVSGSDTAGSIKINTGSGAGAGCFITINFTTRFNSTPNVVISPVGSKAGSLEYYVNRTTSSFSVCSASNPPDGASFGFDYIVFG
jgi:hypothetical protein